MPNGIMSHGESAFRGVVNRFLLWRDQNGILV